MSQSRIAAALAIAISEIDKSRLSTIKKCSDIERVIRKISDSQDQAPHITTEEWDVVVQRAMKAYETRDASALSLKEQRLLIYNFLELPVDLVAWLDTNPRLAMIHARQFLNTWSPEQLPRAKPHFEQFLSTETAHAISPMFRTPKFAMAEFPKFMAQAVSGSFHIGTIQNAFEKFHPLKANRPLGQCLIANIALNASTSGGFEQVFDSIEHDYSSLLNFADNKEKELSNPSAQYALVAAILNYLRHTRNFKSPRFQKLLGDLKITKFGDARRLALSPGWRAVKSLVPDAFRDYLAQLNEQDIRFFFESEDVDMNKDRKLFWTGYIGSMERTIVILDGTTYQAMAAKYKGAESASTQAIEMARTFKHQSSWHALIMIFPTVAVIEFHNTGAACLVINRELFESLIAPKITDYDPKEVKSRSVALNNNHEIRQIIARNIKIPRGAKSSETFSWGHRSRWEYKFESRLESQFHLRKGENGGIF